MLKSGMCLELLLKSDLRGIETSVTLDDIPFPIWLKSDLRGIETKVKGKGKFIERLKSDLRGIETWQHCRFSQNI